MKTQSLALLWLRRDLRLDDHAALHHALQSCRQVQPVFVFDTDILAHFPSPHDRRLSFLAETLCQIHAQLQLRGGGLLIAAGKAATLIPQLAHSVSATQLVAVEDYEPATRMRDRAVSDALQGKVSVSFVKDQVIMAPDEILREGEAFKVYTPYARRWREAMTPLHTAPYIINDQGRYAAFETMTSRARAQQIQLLDAALGPAAILAQLGYHYTAETLWKPEQAQQRLANFITLHASQYSELRDRMDLDSTSRISPYLRFGLISVRACVRAAIEAKADKWLAELIWREFYAMILYHYPESVSMEWNPKYRGTLAWSHNEQHLECWKQGKTGYPIVDAAMRQLLAEGWMHNRARMIVASFLTKHLLLDWRLGEAHFAQYLMDYDLASNVGGWQWSASTGTDAQPYFRIFNPVSQAQKFDPESNFIKRYVPELRNAPADKIPAPWESPLLVPYIAPVVDHADARERALALFKAVT